MGTYVDATESEIKKGGFAWVNRKIFERLASKEEERKPESYFNRNRGVNGAIAGAGIAGYPVVKNEIDRANHLNAVNEREYLDAKDRNIRYRYSQAQSNAIRGQMDGMNEELGHGRQEELDTVPTRTARGTRK